MMYRTRGYGEQRRKPRGWWQSPILWSSTASQSGLHRLTGLRNPTTKSRDSWGGAHQRFGSAPEHWEPILLAAVFCGVLLLQLAFPKQGLDWDGDPQLYIMNALNIINGANYGSTNYIVNPETAINPAAYPPVYPMLLAGAIAVFGLDYDHLRLVPDLSFVLLLVLLVRMRTELLPRNWPALWVASVALNPYVWWFKNTMYSEFSFMFFAYLALFSFDAVDRGTREQRSSWSIWGWAVVCGLAMAAAYQTRSAGVALILAAMIVGALRPRSLGIFTAVAVAIALGVSSAIGLMYPVDGDVYAGYFKEEWAQGLLSVGWGVLDRLKIYVGSVGALVAGLAWRSSEAQLVGLVMLGFIAMGFVSRVRRRITIFEVFFAAYMCMLVVFPMAGEPLRYALPALPLATLYLLFGIASLAGAWRHSSALAIAVAALLATTYAWQYSQLRLPVDLSFHGPEATAFYRRIKEQVPADAVVLCAKPTVIALQAERKTTNPPQPLSAQSFWNYVRKANVRWLVELKEPVYGWNELGAIMPEVQSGLVEMYSDRYFGLYRVEDLRPGAESNGRSGWAG